MNTGGTTQLKIKSKPKFNKRKCLTCKFHGEASWGYPVKSGDTSIHVSCDYISLTKDSCLKTDGKGEIIDTRGNDYNNCLKYKSGKLSVLNKVKNTFGNMPLDI